MPEETPDLSPSERQEHADAAWLLSDQAASKSQPKPSRPSEAASDEGYDVEGGEQLESDLTLQAAPIPPIAPVTRPKERESPPKAKTKLPEASVDQVWSRGAEWGSTLVKIGAVLFVTAFLTYLTLSDGSYSLGLLIALLGFIIAGVLSYPIFITFERPVRVTPEQAAKDYFTALSHLLPHYRRMWLLLSATGREDPEFGSVDRFRQYWRDRLTSLNGSKASHFNQLRFVVGDFRSEKSAGLTQVEGTYTVNVFGEGKSSGQPLTSITVKSSFVRGPDRMWYLNQGKLKD